jgi:hypothetical protein
MGRLSGVLPVLPVLPFSIRHAYTRVRAANGGRLLRLHRQHTGRRGLAVFGEPGKVQVRSEWRTGEVTP